MSKHTPGPWEVVTVKADYELGMRRDALEIVTPERDVVTATPGVPPIRNEADARLIAAAPELLGAAVALLRLAEEAKWPKTADQLAPLSQARAAIAKANGEAA